MNNSIKEIQKEDEKPFSRIALVERTHATEILENDSMRLTPTIRYETAQLRIKNARSRFSYNFTAKERIKVDLKDLDDGLYSYELFLVLNKKNIPTNNIEPTDQVAYLKGEFVMTAGLSRQYNRKWGIIA